MHFLIHWIIQVISFLTANVDSEFRNEHFNRLVNYDDKYVTSGTIWTRTVRSKHYCASHCQADLQCQSFFYKDSTCSGYSAQKPNDLHLVTETGMMFYQRTIDCPSDYTFDETTRLCYRLYKTLQSWAGAKQLCEMEGASLVTVNTNARLFALRELPAWRCAGAFVPILNRCYWKTDTPYNWYQSRDNCALQGIASSFPDVATYEYVVNKGGINGSTEELWIGVNDVYSEMEYKNVDGSNLAFTDYMFDYMTLSANSRDGMVIVPTKNCLWEERDDYISSFRMLCQTELEVDYWIGGKYEAGSSWHWESGELMNQSVFRDGAPNNAVPHYCTTLDYKPSSYAFMNADCLTLKMYVCEHN